ncbi:MAG: hypothetical protein N2B06_02040 [Clostridium sp.]
MELSKKFMTGALTLALSTVLFACADNEKDNPNQNANLRQKLRVKEIRWRGWTIQEWICLVLVRYLKG